jgi:hypothetical protein
MWQQLQPTNRQLLRLVELVVILAIKSEFIFTFIIGGLIFIFTFDRHNNGHECLQCKWNLWRKSISSHDAIQLDPNSLKFFQKIGHKFQFS